MFSNRMNPWFPVPTPSPALPRLLAMVIALMASTAFASDDRPENAATSELVKLVAQKALWPLQADGVESHLQTLGPWKREQPIPEALTWVAGASKLATRAEVSYATDAKKRWSFVGASFFLGAADLDRLYRELNELIQHQIGKPRWTRKGSKGQAPSTGWRLANRLELLLGRSPVDGEKLLVLTISEPQGGPGD